MQQAYCANNFATTFTAGANIRAGTTEVTLTVDRNVQATRTTNLVLKV